MTETVVFGKNVPPMQMISVSLLPVAVTHQPASAGDAHHSADTYQEASAGDSHHSADTYHPASAGDAVAVPEPNDSEIGFFT